MSLTKSALRSAVKTRLAALSPQTLIEASKAILSRLLALPELVNAKVLGLYQRTAREPAVNDLIKTLDSAILTFPRWNPADAAYDMAVVKDVSNDFVPGKYGILEPSHECRAPSFSEREATVWLVPGLAFDANGGRLGRGGGFYDRLLRYGQTKIGVAFSCQLVEAVPTEDHDAVMDVVVTESGVIDCRTTMI